MSQLKLLDLYFIGEESDDKGVENVLLSPLPSESSSDGSRSPPRPPIRETTFVTVERQESVSVDDDVISSGNPSPLTISSGPEEIPSAPRVPERKRNQVKNQHQTSRVVIRDEHPRRRSGGDSMRGADGTRSTTSLSDHVSDHLSYKDRLRDHINTVRERAVESMSRPQSRSQSRMRMLLASKPARSDRAEDVLKREERELAVALERHQKITGQWQSISKELLTRKAEEEGLEFFTKELEIEDDLQISPVHSEKSLNGKLTAADCIGLKPEGELLVWAPATLAPDNSEKLQMILFYPASKPVALEEKLEEGLNPRFAGDEGLYVERLDSRPRRMKSRLERRLLKVPGGRKWFGPDGEFLSTPCKMDFNLSLFEPRSPRGLIFKLPVLATPRQELQDTPVVLDVQLLGLQFSHHSLFSREHVVAQRLRVLWREFRRLRLSDPSRRLKGQLDALRRAREFASEFDIDRIDNEIHDVSKTWFSESLAEKQVENRLLTTWRDLMRLREEQGFRNTGIQLVVKQKPPCDTAEWENQLGIEIAEAKAWARRQYAKKVEEYEEKHQDGSEDDEPDVDSEPPPTFDETAVELDVKAKFRKCFRSPSEPEVEISMSNLGPPTATSDSREEARRLAVSRRSIVIKLICNGMEVYKSGEAPLSAGFSVKLGERFAVRLVDWPRNLGLQIIENGRSSCDVFLPFPESLATVEAGEVETLEFSSASIVSHNHAGVGCGKELVPCPGGSDLNTRPICLYTSGSVSCRLGWAVDPVGHIMAPPRQFWNVVKNKMVKSGTEGHGDIMALREWVEKARLDPNDPGNAPLFLALDHPAVISNDETDPVTELEFCSADEITNNPRLRLLSLRDRGEPEFRGYQMVPLCEKLIHPDTFKAYETRVARPVEQEAVLDSHLDSHRALGRRRMDQMRQTVLQRCRQARQHRRLSDVVTEEQVPDLGTLGLTLMRWLRPKRPLRPERKQRKKVPVQSLLGQDVSIIVNVVRAFEVPVRKDMDVTSAGGSIDGFSLVNVRPFVSANFRGETARTTAAEGANPTWNQELVLPVHTASGQFSPGELAGMKDTLFLHLFDEVVVDLVEEEGLREDTVHQRLERHWLAGLEIPFSTLYCNSRVEGTFQLYSPPVLLGYEREAHRMVGGALPQRDATYLTLFITVQPALNPPEPFLEVFETSETPAVEAHLRGWQVEVHALFPSRKVRPLVSTAVGKAVCITRLIRPLAPPNLPAPESAAAAARFVARIPTMASATFYPGLLDVWLTCDQVVGMVSGGAEDHAVLLCCFLLHMGLPAYLLLGIGIPHGPCAYVLVNSPGAEVVWDASTGLMYSVSDSFCPLQKVHSLINSSNIWANIQQEDSPRRIRFDVKKRADWLPAFNKNMASPSESVQPEFLEYPETCSQAVQALQDKLESKLRDGIMKWRKRQRTQWNRYCAATMRKLLPRLEEAAWDANDPSSPDHWQGLNHILMSHKVCGFPINMPYTDMDAVLEAVKATRVHCTESDDIELALAVYIYPYPCDVLSVWVYVASLTRRR